MRLSELIGKHVVDEIGADGGRVHDVRVIQDGPLTAGFDAALHVQGLVVGRGAFAERLGYGRSAVHRGPWLLRVVLEGRRKPRFVPWERVRAVEEDRVLISGSCADLGPPELLSSALSRTRR